VVTIVILAALARAAVYVADRSLASDEPFIVLNLERRSFGGLTGQLDWNQAVPVGFLEVEKALVTLFGSTEHVVRAAVFVASLFAVALFARLAVEAVRDYAVPLAILLFSAVALGVSYAAIAKPYELDVLVTVALYLSTIAVLRSDRSTSSIVALAVLGIIAPLLSYASVFVLAASATVVVADAGVSRSHRRMLEAAFASGAWLTVLLVVYFAHSGTFSHARDWPANQTLRSFDSLQNLTGNVRDLLGVASYSNYLGYSNGLGATFSLAAAMCAALFLTTGAVGLVRSDWRRGCLLLLPGVFMLVASALGWYPILTRALLFLIPALALCAAEGFRILFEWSRAGAARSALLALLALLITAEIASTARAIQSVRPDDGMKPVMRILADHERATDTIYLDFASQYAFAHYFECRCAGRKINRARREGLWDVSPVPGDAYQWAPALRSHSRRFRLGVFHEYGLRGYFRDFARLPADGRVWVILSNLDSEQRHTLIRRLDSKGRRLTAFHADGGVTTVSLLLYVF
jgi:hypothetical protein